MLRAILVITIIGVPTLTFAQFSTGWRIYELEQECKRGIRESCIELDRIERRNELRERQYLEERRHQELLDAIRNQKKYYQQ